MDIKRAGSQPSGKGPAEWFTGTVRIDPLFSAPDPARVGDALVTFEEKISDAARQRPALERLLQELRADDILVVTRLDRFARSTAELLRMAEVIAEKDAGLQSLDEPWANTTTPVRRMVLTVFAGVAEFERALIRHRTDEGRQAPRRVLRPATKTVSGSEGPLLLPLPRPRRQIHSISEAARTFNVHPATIHRCLNAAQVLNPAL